jgi:uncharacterized protein YneF (UPF0154 family)
MIVMNNWRLAVAYSFLAVVFLGFCLYIAFNYLISVAPPLLIYTVYPYTFTKSTILSDMLPWFFWTAICFIVASMSVGLYMGAHVIVKKRWENIVYIFAPAFLLAFLQNVAFLALIYNDNGIPQMTGIGSFAQETMLTNFFVSACFLPLFCFVVASLGVGLCIGPHIGRKTHTSDHTMPQQK